MRIAEILARATPSFSFEFYAPYAEDSVSALLETVHHLSSLNPAFVSVTCSTGSRRRRTLEIAARIKGELGIEVMAHLTCLGWSRDELHAMLRVLAANRIENVLALRGDPPRREIRTELPVQGFAHASELVTFIADNYDFCIAGACYPQGHPASASPEEDLDYLVRKVDAGAEFLITQAFFENTQYFTFVERARAAGIRVPILPGIMPPTDLRALERIAALDPRTTVPLALRRELERRASDPHALKELGVAFSALQCEELLHCGVPGIHFYTLNQASATDAVMATFQHGRPGDQMERGYGPAPPFPLASRDTSTDLDHGYRR